MDLDVAEDGDDHGRPKSAIWLKGYQIWHFPLDVQATRAGVDEVTAELWVSKCLYIHILGKKQGQGANCYRSFRATW